MADWSDYYSGQRVDSLARFVALVHHDCRVCGSIPRLGSFNLDVVLTLKAPKYCYITQETKGVFQFEIIINVLVSSFRFFEYLCYGSTAFIKVSRFQCEIDFRRQRLSAKLSYFFAVS